MKKILFVSTLLAFSLFGCQDVNDKFDWLDDAAHPPRPSTYDLTLTEANITTIVSASRGTANQAQGEALQKDKAFSENASPEILIPYLFPSLYYAADLGSTANVTYNYKIERDAELAGLSTSSNNPAYVLGSDDYKSVWGEPYATALTPSKSPANELPKLLAANFPDAEAKSYKIIEYSYSAEEPVVTPETIVYSESFDDLGLANNDPVKVDGWLNLDLEGARNWQMKLFNGNYYAQATSYNSKSLNDTWLITKAIDLKGVLKPFFSFDVNVGNHNASCLDILVSDNFDGVQAGITTATWANVTSSFTIPTGPTTGYGANFVNAGKLDLATYAGKTIYVAFRYKGDDVSASKATTTYQIDNVVFGDLTSGREVENKETLYAAYEKSTNGNWYPVSSDVVVLQPADYEFVKIKNGYMTTAQASINLSAILLKDQPQIAGSQKVVVYKNSPSSFYADRLTYTPSVWTINSQIEQRTGQFVKSTSGWVFDPTILVTMNTADCQLVVDYVANNLAINEPKLVNSAKTVEYYYGFNAPRYNLTFRNSDRINDPSYPADGTDAEKLDFCKKRAIEGLELFLSLKYPDATAQVGGIDQFADVTVIIYYGPAASNVETFVYQFQCVGAKEWKFVKRTSSLTGLVEEAE